MLLSFLDTLLLPVLQECNHFGHVPQMIGHASSHRWDISADGPLAQATAEGKKEVSGNV